MAASGLKTDMCSDRELLELAAKAARIELGNYVERICDYYSPWDGANAFELKDGGYWNPLDDDGNAMRLQIHQMFSVSIYEGQVFVVEFAGQFQIVEDVPAGGDIYAATRRAIVRAAAETGAAMRDAEAHNG